MTYKAIVFPHDCYTVKKSKFENKNRWLKFSLGEKNKQLAIEWECLFLQEVDYYAYLLGET